MTNRTPKASWAKPRGAYNHIRTPIQKISTTTRAIQMIKGSGWEYSNRIIPLGFPHIKTGSSWTKWDEPWLSTGIVLSGWWWRSGHRSSLITLTRINTPNKSYPSEESIGGIIAPKLEGIFRLSSMGIHLDTIKDKIQHALDLHINVQCFSKINLDTSKNIEQQTLQNSVWQIDNSVRSTWRSSQILSIATYNQGGIGMATFGAHAGRIKESGNDALGRWSYQIMDCKESTWLTDGQHMSMLYQTH